MYLMIEFNYYGSYFTYFMYQSLSWDQFDFIEPNYKQQQLQQQAITSMYTFTDYDVLSLAQWQSAGQIACFCVEPQAKERAENFFCLFLENPNPELLLRLFQEGSNTLLFVLFSYLIKKPQVFSRSINNFEQIANLISGWKITGQNMVRNNQKIQGYVLRTLFTAFGFFLRGLCLNEGNFRHTLNIVRQSNNINFKLTLMKYFFQAIESKQPNASFLSHKLGLSKYQAMVIPQVIDMIFPCFYAISEKMEVGELINLQGQLKMSQGINIQTKNSLAILEEQQDLMSLIFDLIKHLSQFSYNLSYSDFQGQEPSETKMIFFPETVISKIATKQFLQALFFIMDHAQESNSPKIQKSVIIGLDCVSKLFQGRLLDLSEKQRADVVVISVRRLTNTLMMAREKHFNIEVIQAIMACSKKMFMIYDLKQIKQIILQNTNSAEPYERYLNGLTSTVLAILSTQVIEFQTKAVFDAIDLAAKILINHGYSYTEVANPSEEYFMSFATQVMNSFLTNLCSSQKSLLSCRGTDSMSQNKMMLFSIFEGIKRISCYNYMAFFMLIEQKTKILIEINDFCKISTGLGNLFFLLSQIIQKQYLEKTIFLNPLKRSELILLSKITKNMTFLAKEHSQRRTIYRRINQDYYQFGILCFIESVIADLIIGLKQYDVQKVHLRMPYYLINIDFNKKYASLQQFRQPIRKMIIEYERIVMQYLSAIGLPTDQQHLKMKAALGIIQFIVNEIRGSEAELNKINKIQFQHLIKQRYNDFIPYQEQRSKIFMLRSKLSINQQGISRKILIQRYVKQLLQKPSHLALYDLMGVLQGINDYYVLVYFLKYLKRDVLLSNFLWMNVEKAQIQGSPKLISDSIYAIRCMLNHKGFRMKSSPIVYQIFQTSLPFFNRIAEEIVGRDQIDIEFWQGTLTQLYITIGSMVSSKQINYFAYEYSSGDNYKQKMNNRMISKTFFLTLLRILDNIIPKKFRTYPRLEQAGIQFFGQITKHMMRYIFYDESSVIVGLYVSLYKKMLNLLFEYIEQKLRLTKQTENNFQQSIADIKNLLSFFTDHKSQNQIFIKNLRFFFNQLSGQNEDVNHKLGYYMITVLLSSNGFVNFSWRSCGLCLYHLGRIRKEYIVQAVGKMKIQNNYTFRILEFAEEINTVNDEEFLGKFKAMQREIWGKQ